MREERKPKRLERVSTSRSLLPRLERSGARAGNSYGGRGASGGGGGEGGREGRSGKQSEWQTGHLFVGSKLEQ